MSEIYTNQAIFDAIVAATHIEQDSIIISTSKFVEAFNNHRDRALCGSLVLPPPQVDSGREEIARALQDAIDVFEGMNDDEINVELLPRLRLALRPERSGGRE